MGQGITSRVAPCPTLQKSIFCNSSAHASMTLGWRCSTNKEPPMASLQKKGESYYCQFMYHGKRYTFTVGAVSEEEAGNKSRQVDYLLMRLKQRLIVLPDGVDIVTFVEHDGKPPDIGPTLADAPRKAVTLGHLKERYLTTHANGVKGHEALRG